MTLEFFIKLREMVSSGLVKMAQTARNTTSAMRGANGQLAQSYEQIRSRIDSLEASISKSRSLTYIRSARRELAELQRQAARAPGNLARTGFFGGLNSQLAGVLPAVGLAGAMMLGGQSVGTAMRMDSNARAIDFATGGQGAQAIASIRAINDRLGLSNEAGIEGFKTLAGSVRSLNMPLSETTRIYESVGSAAAAMGVNAEAQKGIFLALGQIASKGTVQAEELRGQIGERLPGAFGIAAKAMGMTERQLSKMMERGELTAKDFLPKFAAELQKTFGVAAAAAADGPQAVFNRFDNDVKDLSITLGTVLLPPLMEVMKAFRETILWIKENWSWIGLLVSVLGTALVAYKIFTAAQMGLNFAMAMNPIGLVVAGIAALVAAIIYAWNKFEVFRGTVTGLWEAFKTVFTNIATFFQRVFAPVFEAIEAFKNGDYSKAAAAAGRAVWNLTGPGLAIEAAKFANEGGFTAGVKNSFNSGYNKGTLSWQVQRAEQGKQDRTALLKSLRASKNERLGINPIFGTTKTETSAVDETVRGVTGGGPRVININGVKFTDKIEIHTTTLERGLDGIKDQLDEYFLRLLNSGAAVQ